MDKMQAEYLHMYSSAIMRASMLLEIGCEPSYVKQYLDAIIKFVAADSAIEDFLKVKNQ